MPAGTPAQEKRIKAAASAWSVCGSNPLATQEELLAVLAEFHAAKSDIYGRDDGYVPNAPALMKRFMRSTPKDESESDRVAYNKMRRELAAMTKAEKKAEREVASRKAKVKRAASGGKGKSIHIAPPEGVLPIGVMTWVGAGIR